MSPRNIPQMISYHLIFETMTFSLDSHLRQLGFILSGISCSIIPFITFELAPYPEIGSAPILSVISRCSMSLLAGWVGPSLMGLALFGLSSLPPSLWLAFLPHSEEAFWSSHLLLTPSPAPLSSQPFKTPSSKHLYSNSLLPSHLPACPFP